MKFKGELREEQKVAMKDILQFDTGILHAATAFGKTVVCSAIIAEKKVNTLIILESSALMEQWKEALENFLDIDEKLPEYKTKTGRGNNSKKEHQKILKELHAVNAKETLILVATGSLIGEGFDYPRLDTLFMAMPVSFRSVVEQYAGRLNRDYEGKENVIVYDYVDSHIPMFDNMYAKRLKAYRQIGYDICGGPKSRKQTANAIFDYENYFETYKKDLLQADKNIVISSPVISGAKVYELISLLHDKQVAGVEITIVTWEPDSYGFGDAAFWMQLHEEMRQVGFYVKTVEESCEHFAIVDQEIVWYGSMNLLSKSNAEDSMMRVQSKKIAMELMGLTFGKES